MLELDVAEQEEVDVQGPRPVPRPAEHAPVLGLDRLAGVEQVQRLEVGGHSHHRVQEVGLVEDLANRLGLVRRRDRQHLDPMLAEKGYGAAQVLLAVADIRTEPEEAGPALIPHCSSSSSSSTSKDRSCTTSTATSSKASGSGGSGFDARTRTTSQPNRSASRSPITWASRSRVR